MTWGRGDLYERGDKARCFAFKAHHLRCDQPAEPDTMLCRKHLREYA